MAGNRHEHHHRKARSTGGVLDAEEDVKTRPEARTNAKKIDEEAEERKRGGRAHGGKRHGAELHHKSCGCHKCMGGRAERKHGGRMEEKKHVEVHGEHGHHRADRKPRKSGGRTGADAMPFSSARHGSQPADHKTEVGVD